MLHKYKITFWKLFCITIIISSYLSIFIYINSHVVQETNDVVLTPISLSGSNKIIVKRGKHPSITTIKEGRSPTKIDINNSYDCSDWTTITWEKKDGS